MTRAKHAIYHAQRPPKPADKPRPIAAVALIAAAIALVLFGVLR
jgi:hypothetical protein